MQLGTRLRMGNRPRDNPDHRNLNRKLPYLGTGTRYSTGPRVWLFPVLHALEG